SSVATIAPCRRTESPSIAPRAIWRASPLERRAVVIVTILPPCRSRRHPRIGVGVRPEWRTSDGVLARWRMGGSGVGCDGAEDGVPGVGLGLVPEHAVVAGGDVGRRKDERAS